MSDFKPGDYVEFNRNFVGDVSWTSAYFWLDIDCTIQLPSKIYKDEYVEPFKARIIKIKEVLNYPRKEGILYLIGIYESQFNIPIFYSSFHSSFLIIDKEKNREIKIKELLK